MTNTHFYNIPENILAKVQERYTHAYLKASHPVSWNKTFNTLGVEFLKSMGVNVFAIKVLEARYQRKYERGIHPHGMNLYMFVEFCLENGWEFKNF